MTTEELFEHIRAQGGVPATCYCKGLPPARAEAWNEDEQSPTFGMTPLMLPPPHNVLVLAEWFADPWNPGKGRAEICVFGPEGCQHPMLTFEQSEHAKAFIEQMIAAADEGWPQ